MVNWKITLMFTVKNDLLDVPYVIWNSKGNHMWQHIWKQFMVWWKIKPFQKIRLNILIDFNYVLVWLLENGKLIFSFCMFQDFWICKKRLTQWKWPKTLIMSVLFICCMVFPKQDALPMNMAKHLRNQFLMATYWSTKALLGRCAN